VRLIKAGRNGVYIPRVKVFADVKAVTCSQKTLHSSARFDDLMAVNMKITVIWDVMPCIPLFILLFNMII
jgi:hypothetical protein